MVRSATTVPHVTHTDSADATALADLRAELAPAAEEEGVRLTYTPFVLKAVATALAEYPYLNATLDEEAEEIRLHDEYDLGVATATDAGLLVPVVENVDGKGLLAVAREVDDLAGRARDRSITREEMQGSTFTVTNVGAVGGEYATPIVNYPEVGILALGAIRERPRVVDGEVRARLTLPLSLSFDHRVLDGAVAARFTNRVISLLETPSRLLLE
jgi:pyruvate dehydrogenase E2 component (dihydrolipoamide acetyltransferase)